MSERTIADIATRPVLGDVVEVQDTAGSVEILLRVLAVVDGHVGVKEYGKGRFFVSRYWWERRLMDAASAKVYEYPQGPPELIGPMKPTEDSDPCSI